MAHETGEITVDCLDQLIHQAESLVQRLVASKAALQSQQGPDQHQVNRLSSPTASPSRATHGISGSHIRTTLEDLALVAQHTVKLSTLYLFPRDAHGGPDSTTPGAFATEQRLDTSQTGLTLTSANALARPNLAISRTPLPPSPPNRTRDNTAELLSVTSPQGVSRTDLGTPQPNTPPSSEAEAVETEAEATRPRVQSPTTRGLEAHGSQHVPGTKRQSQQDNPRSTKKLKTSASKGAGDALTSNGNLPQLEKLILKLKSNDKLCRIPIFPAANPPSATMLQRVAAIQGGPAIRQFCSLVLARRDRQTEMGLLHSKNQGIERAVELWKSIGKIAGNAALNSFMLRLAQYHMAAAVDGTKLGRIRADTSDIKKMMEKFGYTEADRFKFSNHLSKGRLWRSVCGRLPGLMCLIPLRVDKPYCVSANDYLSMRGNDLEKFAQLVDTPYVARICQACESFQDMVMGVADDMVFKWEKEHPELPYWEKSLSDDILLPLLQPHNHCEENEYDGDEFPDWAKPADWPADWPWPAHPLAIFSADRQCDLCDESKCQCLYTKLTARRPRIKSWGKLGLGLQAVAGNEGELSYRKGDVLGQICGKLAPSGTHHHNTSGVMDMQRPDIAGEPVVCQIYIAEASNCFMTLNHCCRASARVRPLRVSGHWICAIEATRDIRHGEQITVNFGKRFLRNQGLRCECEACRENS